MRNPTYEQALNKQGVRFRYEEAIPLDQIDAAKGIRNQARLEEPIDKNLVEQYQVAMENGDQFPPLVLWRPGRGRYIPVDGNQRLLAKTNLKHKTTDAYIIETEDQMVADRLTWSFNNLVNGKRLTAEESLQHAITFVRKYNMTAKDAAKEWGIPAHRVLGAVRVLNTREKVEQQGVKVSKNLTDVHIMRLSSLDNLGDDVLAKAVDMAGKNGLSDNQCQELTQRVKAAKTHDTKLKAIEDYTQEEEVIIQRGQTKGGYVAPRVLPRDRLATLVGQLSRLTDEFEPKVLRPVPQAKYKRCREEAEWVINQLTLVFGLGALLPKGQTEKEVS